MTDIIIANEPTTEELAAAAFDANERVKALSIMNTPEDPAERRKAAIELAVAREAANRAQAALDRRVDTNPYQGKSS